MTAFALGLVLISAMIHATWNLLAKRAGGGQVFVWSFSTLSSLILMPIVIIRCVALSTEFSLNSAVFIAGTTVIHLVYFFLLQRAYKSGDLSLVYPLARGLGPTLAAIAAVILLNERPSALAVFGIVLVIAGVMLLTVRGSNQVLQHPRQAICYGVSTGICIAVYTVWDKYTVSTVGVSPLVLESCCGMGISLVLTPHALRHKQEVRRLWNEARVAVVGVAVMAPLSYILVLTAMAFTPLTYVAPAREISILFAAFLGTQVLKEGHTPIRLVASAAMVCGVIALAVG